MDSPVGSKQEEQQGLMQPYPYVMQDSQEKEKTLP
jgi:hypothetical protein